MLIATHDRVIRNVLFKFILILLKNTCIYWIQGISNF